MFKKIGKTALIPVLLWMAAVCSPDLQGAEDKAPVVHHKTLWETIYEGGWVMVPIGACSVLTFFLCGDGWMRTSRNQVAPKKMEAAVKQLLQRSSVYNQFPACAQKMHSAGLM